MKLISAMSYKSNLRIPTPSPPHQGQHTKHDLWRHTSSIPHLAAPDHTSLVEKKTSLIHITTSKHSMPIIKRINTIVLYGQHVQTCSSEVSRDITYCSDLVVYRIAILLAVAASSGCLRRRGRFMEVFFAIDIGLMMISFFVLVKKHRRASVSIV